MTDEVQKLNHEIKMLRQELAEARDGTYQKRFQEALERLDMSKMTEDEAYDRFDKWYQACLDNGIEPEKIVERMGEMKLLTTIEDIELFETVKEIQ